VIKIINENNIQKNDEILCAEWVPAGKFIKVLVLFVCLSSISSGIIITAFIPKELAFLRITFGVGSIVVSIIIFLIYWNYRGLKITLTKNQLDVEYGIFNHKKIPIKKITRCEITKANFRKYCGVGIRFGSDGSLVYNTDFGDAVKLTFQDGRPFVFSTRNPQEICNLIDKLSN
jgi:uncharacterized membrane protein YdbT with pleckstrin-like domain